MKKWLEKYVPKAQNGIEGTMGGLTDKGFNYNGAWGGQFAMGGSLPGATGMMYARTGAPSNGKYAKKTMASAENGKEMQFYQEGLDFTPKTISQDGSEIPQAQIGITASFDNPRVDNTFVKKPNTSQYPIGFANDPNVTKYNKVKNDPNWGEPYEFLMNWYAHPETKKRLNVQGAPERPMTEALNQKRHDSYLDWYIAKYDKNEKSAHSKKLKDLLNQNLEIEYRRLTDETSGFHVPKDSLVALNSGRFDKEKLHKTAVHEVTHATPLDDFYIDYFKKNKPKNPSGSEAQYFSENPEEIYPRIQDIRYQMWKDKKIVPGKKITPKMLEGYDNDGSEDIRNYYSPEELSKIMNEIASTSNNKKPITQAQDGGEIVKDDMGYWNPDNWGKPVEIDSNIITMEGVDVPLIGISDTGDVQYMEPGEEEYVFDGETVTEYPVARNGINQADAHPKQKLDQLLNFTNYNKPAKGGWLDKYN